MISFDAVTLELAGRTVLAETTLELAERRIGLLGANGSGKSSLLRLAGGLIHPTGGAVTVCGHDTRAGQREVRAAVGYLFQNPEAQLVLARVDEDVALGLTRGVPSAVQRDRVAAALGRLGIEALSGRLTHQLSGGEQQLVALAGALVREPRVLLFDEPTTHLDLRFSERLRALIDGLDQQLVIASHDLELIDSCQRVLVLDGGAVRFDGAAAEAVACYRELVRWS